MPFGGAFAHLHLLANLPVAVAFNGVKIKHIPRGIGQHIYQFYNIFKVQIADRLGAHGRVPIFNIQKMNTLSVLFFVIIRQAVKNQPPNLALQRAFKCERLYFLKDP